jgi:hypothetical protein
MAEFIINTPGRAAHPFYALDEFAMSYIEAMFFTNCDSGDERENLANELGVERLTRASVARIKEDCDAFQAAAAVEIKKTLAHGERDLAGIAHDFWFTRQRHGVGFREGESRGYPGEIGDELDRIAKAAGEVYPEIYRGWIHYR